MNEEIQTTYDFSDINQCLEAHSRYWDTYQEESVAPKEVTDALILATKAFFRTRKNSELIDIPEEDGFEGLSIYDFESVISTYYGEIEKRVWEYPDKITSVLQEIGLGEYRHTKQNSVLERLDALEKQVSGIQKKVDKMVQLLENFEIKISVKDALTL